MANLMRSNRVRRTATAEMVQAMSTPVSRKFLYYDYYDALTQLGTALHAWQRQAIRYCHTDVHGAPAWQPGLHVHYPAGLHAADLGWAGPAFSSIRLRRLPELQRHTRYTKKKLLFSWYPDLSGGLVLFTDPPWRDWLPLLLACHDETPAAVATLGDWTLLVRSNSSLTDFRGRNSDALSPQNYDVCTEDWYD